LKSGKRGNGISRDEVKNFKAYYVYRDENGYTNIAELNMD